MSPDNVRYIQKSREMISDSLLDMLHYGPGDEAKLQTANALGCLAYALDKEFPRYLLLHESFSVTIITFNNGCSN